MLGCCGVACGFSVLVAFIVLFDVFLGLVVLTPVWWFARLVGLLMEMFARLVFITCFWFACLRCLLVWLLCFDVCDWIGCRIVVGCRWCVFGLGLVYCFVFWLTFACSVVVCFGCFVCCCVVACYCLVVNCFNRADELLVFLFIYFGCLFCVCLSLLFGKRNSLCCFFVWLLGFACYLL